MRIKGIIFIVAACIFWGTIGLFNHGLLKCGFDSATIASIRCIVSAVVLWIYILFKKEKHIKINKRQLMAVSLEGVAFYVMAVLYFIAIVKTSPATASVLLNTAPIMVMSFSVIFWKEKLTVNKIVAIFMSLLGCCFIAGIFTELKFDIIGIVLGLLSAVCYALYSICTKVALRRKMDTEANIAYSFLFSALAALIYSNPVNLFKQVKNASLEAVILLIGIGIFTGALAGLTYTKGMKLLPAGMASAFAALEPLVSATLSVIFLGEVLKTDIVIGIVLILVAVTILSIKTKTERKKN